MKKILLLLFFIIPICSFCQVDTIIYRTPEIELPDFVIMGTTKIEMPTQTKETPDVISNLPQEFILPRIGIEKLELEGLTDPSKQQATIKDSVSGYNFRAIVGGGIYNLPNIGAFYSQKINRMSFNAFAKFNRTRNYIPNSGNHEILVGGNSTFLFLKDNEPPARLRLNGYFSQFNYSPFASNFDNKFRTSNLINVNGVFENLFWREFNVDLGGTTNIHYIPGYNSTFFEFNPFVSAKSYFEHFELSVKFNPYLLKSSTSKYNSDLVLALNSEMNFKKLFNFLNFSASLDYQSLSEIGKQFLGPSAKLDLGFDENFFVSLFYENKMNLVTPNEIWRINPYVDTSSYNYYFERVKDKIGINAKIYFSRFSNIDLGFSTFKMRLKTIFQNSSRNGYFDLYRLDTKTNEFKILANLDFQEFGSLFVDAAFRTSKLTLNSLLEPFSPKFQINSIYFYKFDFSLLLRFRFLYNSSSFADINNGVKVGSMIDFGMDAEYGLNKNFKLGMKVSNLLNRRNYLWFNYELKPFDMLLYLILNL